jgi:hypothetical protein
MTALATFFHVHIGCLDEDGQCHALCFRTEVIWIDGSHAPEPQVFCPNEEKHPGTMLDLRGRADEPEGA